MPSTWNIKHTGPADDIVDIMLKNRGIAPVDAEAFLHPDWERDTYDPFLFTRMNDAVARMFAALEAGEKVMIHGDYDADGISGSALLFTALRDICERTNAQTPSSSPFARGRDAGDPPPYEGGARGGLRSDLVSVFLPDRERDGYGVATHTIERFAEEGVKLVVTVDCGISNAESLGRARELGMDVIICDHHQLGTVLPDAIIIHPLAPGEEYPNKSLCGTGVAFKFASALIHEATRRGAAFPPGYEKWFLDLVAIATVTDVVPLLGENRVLEKFGLTVLNKTRREGIRRILDYSRGEMGAIDTEVIGFQIGPRINAAGRIASAEIAFKALAARTEEEARTYAIELERLNRERRNISDAVYKHAVQIAREKENKIINVIWHDDWLHGVVGLVAGKIVRDFGTPAFVFTKVGDHYVGSGRSIGGLHLVEAMRSCGDIFIKAGGHPQACGVSLASADLLPVFEEGVTKFAEEYFGGKPYANAIDIEAEIPLSLIDWDLLEQIQLFEPFGEMNRKPFFLSRNVPVLAAETMGADGKHLRLTLNNNGRPVKLVGFGFGALVPDLRTGECVDVVYEIGVNEWNGRRELQLKIADVKMSVL